MKNVLIFFHPNELLSQTSGWITNLLIFSMLIFSSNWYSISISLPPSRCSDSKFSFLISCFSSQDLSARTLCLKSNLWFAQNWVKFSSKWRRPDLMLMFRHFRSKSSRVAWVMSPCSVRLAKDFWPDSRHRMLNLRQPFKRKKFKNNEFLTVEIQI